MPGSKYRYANSYVLINKLGITDGSELFQTEQHCENNVGSVFSLYRHYLSSWFDKIRVIKAIKIMYENRRDADEPQISKAGTGRGY